MAILLASALIFSPVVARLGTVGRSGSLLFGGTLVVGLLTLVVGLVTVIRRYLGRVRHEHGFEGFTEAQATHWIETAQIEVSVWPQMLS